MLLSPLRYPGGKGKLFKRVSALIEANRMLGWSYAEPYAGGAGLAIKLLTSGLVDQVVLNDIDPSVVAFWKAVLFKTDEFCSRIAAAELHIEEWKQQKALQTKGRVKVIDLGFSTFYLNRTNRSGIIAGAGPIGGYEQDGDWKLDARFNKLALIRAIQLLAGFKDRISISGVDAAEFIVDALGRANTLTYLDPPYYVKGHRLYRNHYVHDDHVAIADILAKHRDRTWIVSYDDVPEIRKLYAAFSPVSYDLHYSASRAKSGREVMYVSDAIQVARKY